MRELAMRPVHPPPLFDQIEDRLLLPVQDPVHRAATRMTVFERAGVQQPLAPMMRATISQIEHAARPGVRRPLADSAIDQPQQLELGLRAHARGNRAE